MSKQEAYYIVDEWFQGFVDGNRKFISSIREGSSVEIKSDGKGGYQTKRGRKLNTLHIFTFDIHHIAKSPGMDGPYIVFLDADFNKIYSLYDVE